jgi:HAMP domain-containing protein
MNLRFKVPLMVATAAGIVFVTTGYVCSNAQFEYIETMRRQQMKSVATLVKSGIEGVGRGASLQADFLSNLGSVRDSLRTGNREALEATMRPVYALLSVKAGAEQAFFYDRDETVFLDVLEPERYGQDMSGREIVVRANRYHETLSGVQVTPAGLAVRAVASIDSGTEHLGSFEWGVSLGRLLARIKENTGTDLTVFVDERSIPHEVAATGSGSRGAAAAPEAEAGGLKSVVSTNADLVKSVLTNDFLAGVQEDIYSARAVSGTEYDILGLPLFDFAGRQIGVIGGVKSVTDSRHEVAALLAASLIGTGIGAVLLAVAVFLTFELLLRRPLAELEESLEVFARAGDFDRPVTHQGRPDEFGSVSKSLNKLREKLNADAKLALEAENIVTTRRLRKFDKETTIE